MDKNKHVLDFLVTGWPGNFELEFASYVFNAPEWDNEQRDFAKFLTDEEQEETDRVLGDDFTETVYTEYGTSVCDIGSMKDPTSLKTYRTIQVQVNPDAWRDVNEQVIELLKSRAAKFFEVYYKDLPPGQEREGSFVRLVHTRLVSQVVSTAL